MSKPPSPKGHIAVRATTAFNNLVDLPGATVCSAKLTSNKVTVGVRLRRRRLDAARCPAVPLMLVGMTTTKIAVSLPPEHVEAARRAVTEGRAASVSAYVASALEEKAKLDDLAAMLDEMLDETGGPLTAAERDRADRILSR